ncbi:cytochrome P450 [Thermomonospora amylolytica]|uniref:cytochrome P450 n=1 Tax=Thermomonospora amylolytica TaxID=1411117 RepID=UPI000E6D4857|nr:cytochrome P450 [Thermomonospora amylolytica]
MSENNGALGFPFPSGHPLEVAPFLAELRKEGRPVRVQLTYGREAWLVTRYEDARRVLDDPVFGRDPARVGLAAPDVPRLNPIDPTGDTFVSMDPPGHTRIRALLTQAFGARRIDGLRPRIQRIADRLVDRMLETGPPAELIEDFSLPLPIEVLSELLGLPGEDRARFRQWSDVVLSAADLPLEQVMAAFGELDAYFTGLIEERADRPTDDLIGTLTQAHGRAGGLDTAELLAVLRVLLIAGLEVVSAQVPNSVYLLLRDGGYARLVEAPELICSAVEELLRYAPLLSLGSLPRFALADTEVGGVTIRAGEPVIVELSAANRDPAVFDAPESVDIERAHNPHLNFGHGAHHCLGAALARLELEVALSTLVRRLPGLKHAEPSDRIVWRTEHFIRGPQRLPVLW